jgi:hypothetical protein
MSLSSSPKKVKIDKMKSIRREMSICDIGSQYMIHVIYDIMNGKSHDSHKESLMKEKEFLEYIESR